MIALPYPLAGKIFRSEMPFSRYDPAGSLLEDYLTAGISLVVILAEEQEILRATGIDLKNTYRNHGIKVLHFPVPDYETPDAKALDQILKQMVELAGSGRNLVMHCHAGIGRTGLMAACLAKRVMDLPGENAIQWVRAVIPGAIESLAQINFVLNY